MAGEQHQGCGLGAQNGRSEADWKDVCHAAKCDALLGREAAFGADQEGRPRLGVERGQKRRPTGLVGHQHTVRRRLDSGQKLDLGQQSRHGKPFRLLDRLDDPLLEAFGPDALDHPVAAAHRLETGDAELGRLFQQPVEPRFFERGEEKRRAGLGYGRAQLVLELDRPVVALEPGEPRPPFTVPGVENAQAMTGPGAQHRPEIVGRCRIECWNAAGGERLVEMEAGIAHGRIVVAFTVNAPNAK